MNSNTKILGSGRSFEQLLEGSECDKKILDDLQNIVRTGYRDCTRRTYFIRVIEKKKNKLESDLIAFKQRGEIPLNIDGTNGGVRYVAGRLKKLFSLVETINKGVYSIGLDIGFTYEGLEKIKVTKDYLDTFSRKSPAFYDNAFIRAQKHLGDTGLSAPQYWEDQYCDPEIRKTAPSLNDIDGFDIIVIVHFPYKFPFKKPQENLARIQRFESRMSRILLNLKVIGESKEAIRAIQCDWGVSRDWIEISGPLEKPDTVYFGYRDGITAPLYSKKAPPQDDEGYRKVHALGEILLGYPRNDGDNLYADLGMMRKKNANIGLQTEPWEEGKKIFFRNSSFGVLRKMEQRVEKFDAWVSGQAKNNFPQDKVLGLKSPNGDDYYYSKKWIRSKVMGRTPEGQMLTTDAAFMDIDNSANIQTIEDKIKLGEETGFRRTKDAAKITLEDDSQGLGCPFSSHIRRMNPRDDPVTPFIHRPVIRRGMPYTESDSKKGLSGLFICADIEDQFEHLVGKWANNGVLGIPDESTCKDPIIGNHEPQNNLLYLYSHPVADQDKNKLVFDEPFVVTKGCAYVWFPAKGVLKSLDLYINQFAR